MRQAGVTDARALVGVGAHAAHALCAGASGRLGARRCRPAARALRRAMTKPSIDRARASTALDAQRPKMWCSRSAPVRAFRPRRSRRWRTSVVTLDRWRDLAAEARGRFGARAADADVRTCRPTALTAGPTRRRTIASSSTRRWTIFPRPLLEQLSRAACWSRPLGDATGQRLIRYRNGEREDLGPMKLQPLERGRGEEEAPLPPV